jgi:hypothetical protein
MKAKNESKQWWTFVLDKLGKMKRYNISFRRYSPKIEDMPQK